MQNIMYICARGVSQQIGEIYPIFLAVHILFLETHLQIRPFNWFLRAMAQTTRSCARMCILGITKDWNWYLTYLF